MSNTVITVANAAELMSALAGATGGETIRLQAGNYGDFGLWNVRDTFVNNYTSAVTLTSANPDDLAVFTAVGLNGVKNLSFDAIKFDYTATAGDPDWARPFIIENSTGITIANSVFDGALDYTSSTTGTGTGYGLSVVNSQNVTINHNEFFNWSRAAVFGSVTNLNVTGNDVHDVRSDGFDFADVDNVLIEQNYLHDFVQGTGGDHPDMIQFWTSGTTSPSTNIVIRGNFLDSGTGLSTQSIFMRNEMVDTGAAGDAMFYRNILIEDNVIHNAHVHGITVGETHGLTIGNNTILQNADSGSTGSINVPTINVAAASTGVTVTNNILPRLLSVPSAGALVTNNLIVQSDIPGSANYVGDLFVDALAGANATLADLQAIPGGILQQLGVGSSLTDFLTQPAAPIGFIVDDASSGLSLLNHSLDASNLYGPNGRIDLQGALVVWNFGDGSTASGVAVDHAFAHAGRYEVTATITLVGGTVVQIDKTISVQTPVALQANFDNGAQDLSDITNPVTVSPNVTFEPGASGQAIRLNGGLVTYQVNSELLNNSEFTVLFDFKKDVGQEGAGGRVINFGGSVVIFIGSDGIAAAITTDHGSKWLTVSNIGINDADWHKVALTFSANAGSAILYVDGAAVGQVDGLSGLQVGSSGHDFSIGDPWGGSSFPGLIDNVAFLKGSLNAKAIVDGWTAEGDILNGGGGVALQANFDIGAQDLSDITNPVTVSPNVTFEPGASGQAIRLNGGLVTYQVNSELLNNSEFTVLFDFKKDVGQEGAGGRVINFSGSVVIFIGSDGITAAITTDHGSKWLTVSNIGINDADWHKVALTFSANAGSAILYVDGAAVGQVDGLSGLQVGSSGHDFSIGDPWGGSSFPGLIDNVAFLKGSLSAQEIADGWNSQSQLARELDDANADDVALQANFDNGAQDLSDIANPVTVSPNVTFEPGASGQAIRLNGGVVTYQVNSELLNNSEYTVLFDFKKDAGQEGAGGRVINFSGSVVIFIGSDGIAAAITTDHGSKWLTVSNIGINDADWHKVALTFSANAGSAILYVDGAAVGQVDGLSGLQVGSSGHDFSIGDPWGGSSFPGLIDNVAFLKGSLSAQEIADGWTIDNAPPVALINDHSVQSNEWVLLKNWLSYSDADNNAATNYQFIDAGMGASSGYFYTPDNPHNPAGSYIDVPATDLDTTWIRGGQTAGSETMWVRAFDGTDWSAWDPFTFTTLV